MDVRVVLEVPLLQKILKTFSHLLQCKTAKTPHPQVKFAEFSHITAQKTRNLLKYPKNRQVHRNSFKISVCGIEL